MTQALYRKWRPLGWDEVVSQEHVIQTLKNAVAADRVAHAYLFSGPRGTGKTTAARLLAKAVNCLAEEKTQRPCNRCAHCIAVNENRFMDLIEIDAASNTSVEDVRDLRDKINFAPSQGRYKVYIIDEVHMLSIAAFNALLKTLEEPPPHAIFILATTEIHKIPATVLSRCQRHEFRRFPIGEITRRLSEICRAEGIQAESEALSLIARQSAGGMRDAISLLDQLASTGSAITLELAQTVLGTAANQAVMSLVQALIERNAAAGMDEIHRALDGGADARALARQIVEYLRGLLLIQLGNADQVEATADQRVQMMNHARALPTSEVLRAMRAFNVAATDPRGGWSPSLGLELAFAELLEFPKPDAEMPKPSTRPPSTAQPSPARHEGATSVTANQPQSPSSSPLVSLEAILKAWKQVAARIKAQDVNLAALLNSGKPLEVREGVLLVAFASDILQGKFNRPENLELTRNVLREILGVNLPVQGVVTSGKNALPAHVKPDGLVAAASQLGGEIVDVQ
ncbi:MAG: DNA polymerase III subunit gamma/tau [Anaerolineae bacterium]|nr:MAG: DNA polymerase III subunit gamma/tau [Anaerolineae bacterium]